MARALDLAGASGLLFLCSGNVVRSAFAELYARHLGVRLPVRSAATRFQNDGLFPETRAALLERGVPRAWVDDFRPTFLGDVEPELDPRLVVLGMRHQHLAPLIRHPELGPRCHLLTAALGGPAEEIADPVLEGADFARTFTRIERCVQALGARLEARGAP